MRPGRRPGGRAAGAPWGPSGEVGVGRTILPEEIGRRLGGLDALRSSGAFVEVEHLDAGGYWCRGFPSARAQSRVLVVCDVLPTLSRSAERYTKQITAIMRQHHSGDPCGAVRSRVGIAGGAYTRQVLPPGHPAFTQPLMVRPLWSLPGPALGVMLAAALLTAPIGPLGSAIRRDLDLSTASLVTAVIGPYAVAAAALVVPSLRLGRRWPTAVAAPGQLLLLLGNLASAFAPGVAAMAVAQFVAGLGAGAVLGATLALTGQLGRGRSQVRLALGLALGVALLLGPVVTGVLTRAMSWRTGLFIPALPVATIALAITVVTGIIMLVVNASRPTPSPAAPHWTPSPAAAPSTPATPFPGGATPAPGETQFGDPPH